MSDLIVKMSALEPINGNINTFDDGDDSLDKKCASWHSSLPTMVASNGLSHHVSGQVLLLKIIFHFNLSYLKFLLKSHDAADKILKEFCIYLRLLWVQKPFLFRT